MSTKDLFGASAQHPRPTGSKRDPKGEVRLIRAERHQLRLLPTDLDGLLEPDHAARAIWQVVERVDLSRFEAAIRARGENAGRPAIDPKILLTLWVYGMSEGIGGARELARLCEAHNAYRWICGGVHVSYHTLSDFRVEHQEALDDLMSQILGVLLHNDLVDLKRVAHDGMKVRASAGAASFRREKSLKTCLKEAQRHVKHVTKEAHDAESRSRQEAASERATHEREARVQKALEELPIVRAGKQRDDDLEQTRVSTTDPEARVMKMGDGGYRPAYNIQISSAVEGRAIVGIQVSNSGGDYGQLPRALDQIERRNGQKPREVLADGGFASRAAVNDVASRGMTLYAPPLPPRDKTVDRYKPKPGDSPALVAWRRRMGTERAKEIYKQRAAVAETVNADLRTWRGLDRMPVRGLAKAQSVALLAAITYNVLLLVAEIRRREQK